MRGENACSYPLKGPAMDRGVDHLGRICPGWEIRREKYHKAERVRVEMINLLEVVAAEKWDGCRAERALCRLGRACQSYGTVTFDKSHLPPR